MGIRLGYMGTKKFLAPHVADVIGDCQDGPVLDLFSGMCSVGEALADSRPLWINDIQIFATEVGRALFLSRTAPPNKGSIYSEFIELLEENRSRLRGRFSDLLRQERESLASGKLNDLLRARSAIEAKLRSDHVLSERGRLSLAPNTFPYRLFTLTYSGRFFSLEQSIDIDSLRYAIDKTCGTFRLADRRRWLLISAGVTMLRIAVSTGHFAQFLTPKESNIAFILKQQRRSALDIFWSELKNLKPVGAEDWRKENKAFNSDAIVLLQRMYLHDRYPAIVYADPPYTDDQYSRYYHLWETLVLYDYPNADGKGCYRSDRFQTPFALKSRVESAIDSLAISAARVGAELVMSYPNNGLLCRDGRTIEGTLRKYYRSCERVFEIEHEHSTMGASKGKAKQDVTEVIYVARNPI